MVKQLSDFFAFSDGVKMPVLGFGVYKSPVYHKDKHNSGAVGAFPWEKKLSLSFSRGGTQSRL
jgi:hypothetical protein